MLTRERLTAAYQKAREALLAERNGDGYWLGELSSSALSTATAISALSLVGGHDALVRSGLAWLANHQNDDVGWGDTVKSFSNISTTMLCRAAYRMAGSPPEFATAFKKTDEFMAMKWGATSAQQAEAIRRRYGKDHTFSVPILMNAAMAGLVPWSEVPALPFELACLPQSWYRLARMPVVSYALPALIAIGQTIFHHKPPRNPFSRLIRRISVGRSLRVLQRIQPSSGGFLEATPLTSFVVMALAASRLSFRARAESSAAQVISKGVEFLVRSIRPDGSWPIDSNLSVWVTTLAVNALAAAGDLDSLPEREKTLTWILEQQETEGHPYTGAASGGWGWSHLGGSVPDADDTPGAFLALRHLDGLTNPAVSAGVHSAIINGLPWILDLQNSDGGWPTFCRGWGRLPFDRSGADLTAHALRAFNSWKSARAPRIKEPVTWITFSFRARDAWGQVAEIEIGSPKAGIAVQQGLAFLRRFQDPHGSWLPLWFGNQHAPDDINPTYGTAKVLAAFRDLSLEQNAEARRGIDWLLQNQNDDGGWGGMRGTPSSVEETALAVEVLIDLAPPESRPAVERGLQYLVARVENGGLYDPSPIGFYFAKLWYFEKMYPIVWSVAALGRALRRNFISE
jgi:squalene-hopene/tetraprenyl-beta-curcumene cyclase